MTEYWARGDVTLRGVEFIIEADSLEEEKEKARKGQHAGFYTVGAETSDWTISEHTVRINK